MSDTRSGSRDYPSYDRLIPSPGRASAQCRRARIAGPDDRVDLNRIGTHHAGAHDAIACLVA